MDVNRAAGRPRLADVAARAGVSKKTVSNVINEFPFVADHTRSRVLEAISELGYRPNLSARNLAQGRTGIIALVISQLDMPYFSELARHVVDVAQGRSWVVLIEQTMNDRTYEQRILDGDLSRRIDGLLFSPSRTSAAALHRRTDATPMVLLGEVIYDGMFDHVSIDNVAAAREATAHLLSLGRRRVAAIGAKGSRARGASRQRLEGYQQVLSEAGLPVEPELIRQTPRYVGEAGAAAMEELLDLARPPDAVFCFTDLLALGALRAIHRRGLRVPDDIAIVGHDDIPYGRISTPSLTTISPDKRAIAEIAVDLLEQRVSNRTPPPPREVHVEFALKVRESTAGPAG
ncbi:LacI family DNA-binding transcriptional regulator [Actinopolymorpha sp. B11F2]|uniref:LacI family DNA-binding transcriptional regulator n=1 Tax=Actinopolymorpha sp. B11F2 TaxID=3160862 RepID=UPI0032E47E09